MTETAVSRADHMEWCKRRAREYLDLGKGQEAVTSMLSDLGKHPETVDILKGPLGMMGIMAAAGSLDEARRFIEGFN